jgi:hypothetical protein
MQDHSVSSPPSFPSLSDLKEHLGSPESSAPEEQPQPPPPPPVAAKSSSVGSPAAPQEDSSSQHNWNQLVSSCLNENFKWDNKIWECDVCGKKFTTKYFQVSKFLDIFSLLVCLF